MKQLSRGTVVLAASVALWSCSGDPTDSFRGSPARIDADPSALFITLGETKPVTVEVVDEQGNPLDADITESHGAGIAIDPDTTYLQTTSTRGELTFARRFNVTGTTPTSTSFTLASGGLTTDVPVRVVPTDVAATFSNPTPAANEPVTVTVSGFTFLPTSFVTVGGDTALVMSHAPDESSITILPSPGATGAVTLGNIEAGFIPGAALTLPTAATLTVGALAPLPGTGAPSTAPPLPLPAAGETTRLFDLPDFTATIDHFYRLDVTEAGDYTITVDWDIGSDIDAVVCNDATCSSFNPQFGAASANKPESAKFTLTAGTQVLLVEDFGEDAAGAKVTITVQH